MGDRGGDERCDAIVRDYERVAALGVKRASDLLRRGFEDGGPAFDRLVAAGLAVEQQGAMVLRRPDDCSQPLGDSALARLRSCYADWLRSGGVTSEDELLYGELGFWQHWWNRIRERDYGCEGPLPMDIVVPGDGTFEVRQWLAEFDPDIRAFVLGGGLISGRAIVPPQAVKSSVEPMLDLSTESGFEVRVLSTEARFVLYDRSVAVLNDPRGQRHGPNGDDPEPYRAVRRGAIVEPLCRFFEMLWRSATPLSAYRGEHEEVLEMLARGFTDVRIASALNMSARTVSRRVSEIMTEHGAGSRFELGMMYGRSRRDL